MIPKIVFRNSWIYDSFWKRDLKIYYKAYKDPRTKKILDNYPSPKKLDNYIRKTEKLWRKDEKRVLLKISKIMGLKWKENKIRVYVVGKCGPFSDPLTMCLYKNLNDFIDVLVHELIHQIQMQNGSIMKKWWRYVEKLYKKEPKITIRHVLLHAIHKKIYLDLFDEKRLKRNLKRSVKDSYKRAWQIVEEESHEKIIKKFKELTK